MDYSDFEGALVQFVQRLNPVLDSLLAKPVSSLDFLYEAIRYSTIKTGGHRWRPFILQLCVAALGGVYGCDEGEKVVLHVGAAIEMVHNYSLIHDDLPCMDDDSVRRGSEACHVKFGDGIALLAGDALLCESFKTIAALADVIDPARLIEVVSILAVECGSYGMLRGQSMDIIAGSDMKCTDEEYGVINANIYKKTTSLFAAVCRIASVLCNADEHAAGALALYGQGFGKVYQVFDDISDDVHGDDGAPRSDSLLEARRVELEDMVDDLVDVVKVLPDNIFRTHLMVLPYYLYEQHMQKWMVKSG